MSYNSFKRALGETNLERKCRFLFGFCLLVLIAGSFWWYGHRTEDLVYEQSPNNARYLVDAVLLELHWKSEKQESDPTRKDGFFEWFAQLLQTHSAYQYRLIIPNSDDSEKKPQTDRDRGVLNQYLHLHPSEAEFTAHPEYQADRLNGGKDYQYFQAVRYKQDCIQCHLITSKNAAYSNAGLPAPPPPAAGDLAAVVKVIMPDPDTQTALNKNRAIFLTTALVTVFLAMIALYVVVRYVIVKPLKHLRDVTDEVSRGNIEARAEIHTGDEFEELGSAFNKMLRHLGAVQNELRSVNTNLDTKVDELAQANMRLYELNRLKSDFLATMSHELRTPLNSIIGFSDVLNSIQSLDDKQKRYVQNIQKSGRVLLDMINDILDLAKIESGKMELRLSEFRIDDAISAQCDMARPLTERKNIDLEVVVESNLPELFQDQGKLQQVLNNLLSNAIKFTPEGGRIVVSVRRDASWHDHDQLVLTVADTGVGIAEEDQVAIFEKFRQGKTSLAGGDAMTREYSGTGLGLSIVKELCKLMGGEVSLASESGKGSTFTVRLPWARADQPRMDSPLAENIDELLRPRRVELQRSLDRPVPAAPAAETT